MASSTLKDSAQVIKKSINSLFLFVSNKGCIKICLYFVVCKKNISDLPNQKILDLAESKSES